MMKHKVVAMREHSGAVSGGVEIKLPAGCTGILFCFESKKAAREYWGRDVKLERIETSKTRKGA